MRLGDLSNFSKAPQSVSGRVQLTSWCFVVSDPL